MAADDEFPRGLSQSVGLTSGQVSLTYPATPGIAWVLDSWEIFAIVVLAASGLWTVTATAVGQTLSDMAVNLGTLGDSITDSGTSEIAAAVGNSLVLQGSAAGNNDVQIAMRAHAYPI